MDANGVPRIILLVEENADDQELMLRPLRKGNLLNEIVVAHDGVEALDYLFTENSQAGCDIRVMPQVVLGDLKLPKIDGLEVFRRLRRRSKLGPRDLRERHQAQRNLGC